MYNFLSLKLPKDLIQVERDGSIFQIASDPFSRVRYKGKKKQVIGYKYSLGMHMIAGHGNMDSCEKIRVGEKVVWSESNIVKDFHSSAAVMTTQVITPQTWKAQTFLTSGIYSIASVNLKMYNTTSSYHPGIITVSIRATDGSGHPIGDDLCIGTTDGETLQDGPLDIGDVIWREIEFVAPIILAIGAKYAIVVRTTESGANDSVKIITDDNGSNYTDGTLETSSDMGKTWTTSGDDEDFLFEINAKDGSPPNCTIAINSPDIFGGVRKEGGIQGQVDFMFGDITQEQNPYLKSGTPGYYDWVKLFAGITFRKWIASDWNGLGDDIPAYRGLWSAVLNQVYVGMSGYLKPWSFFLKRCCKQVSGSDQWYKEKAVIRPRTDVGDDLNAIHIIRECLIDSEWGMNEAIANIDDASFKEAANILFDEDFGLTMLWSSETSVEEFVSEILVYIAGALYQDLETGKWVIKLTRDPDYDTPYDYCNVDDNTQGGITEVANEQLAQTFTTSKNYSCNKAKIKIYESAGGTFDVKVEIQGTDVNGQPDGNILAQGTILNSELAESAEWKECTFISNVDLTVNLKYALVIYPRDGAGTLYWRVDTTSSDLSGNYEYSVDDGATWTATLASDFMFEIYAGADLETFNENDIISIENYDRPSYGEIINKVALKYWDKLNHKTRSAEAHDIALIEKQGGAIIEQILNYNGICDPTLANMVAERELNLYTSMLASMRLKCTRKMAHLKPNETFVLAWGDLDIITMTVRILNADYGNLNKNEIILECVEDVFSVAETIHGDAPDTLWSDPLTDAIDIPERRIIEIPYYAMCKVKGSAYIIDELSVGAGFIAVLAKAPSDDSFDYDLLTRLSASYDFEDVGQGQTSFTPTCEITSDLPMNADDVTIDYDNATDLELIELNSIAIINNEVIQILDVDIENKQIQIARGVLDTVPAAHSTGDIIYITGGVDFAGAETEYNIGDQPQAKLLPRTSSGSLAEADATAEIADTLDSRLYRPYCPGNLKFQGDRYPALFSSTVSGKMAITWTHRNRLHATQLNAIVKQTDATDFGREGGTATYTVKVYDENNSLIRTVAGLTGSSYDYTEAFERADCGLGAEDPLNNSLRFVIYAVRDSYDSFQSHDVTIERALIGEISAISSASGGLDYMGIVSSAAGTAGADGFLNLQSGLEGSADNDSGITGSLTV